MKKVFLNLLLIPLALTCDFSCSRNTLSSNGDFAIYYPRFLGTWVYEGEWDGNPFFACIDCNALIAYVVSSSFCHYILKSKASVNWLIFQLFLRDSANSEVGHWAITDCHPNDVACGGAGGNGAHKLLLSPLTTSQTCLHQIPQEGWQWCSGELIINGICTEYRKDDTIQFTCA